MMPHKQGRPNGDGLDISLNYRAMPIMGVGKPGTPASHDEQSRSVEMIGASENPVNEIDWDRWEMVPTVLRMDGCQMPANGQLPLLDTHARYNTSCVIGSYRDMRIDGQQLLGRAYFSTAPEAEGPYLKTTEGHLTDCSIARKDLESTYIPAGQKQNVGGIEYEGPIRVVTSWIPKEMSMCPIGADEMTKVRAATPTVIPTKKKEEEMDPKVRAFLVTRGLSETATEAEAYAFMEKLDVRSEPAQPATPDINAITEQVRSTVLAEQTRCSEIRSICDRAGFDDTKIAAYIKDGASVDAVRSAAFEHIVTNGPTAGGTGFRGSIEVGRDERDKFRSAAEDSLILRSGRTIEKPAAGASDLIGFSLRELARESLRMAGQPVSGDALGMVGRALTTSDLPSLLANVANKSLFEGYTSAQETWNIWCGTGSASDFKTNSIVRTSEMDDLDEIPEEAEYKYGKRSDAKEEFKLATYGKLFAISRQTIINDDLGALTDIPAAHGEAWSRKIGDIAYAVLTANSNMGDGTALFHANHGNLGTTGAVSETTIAEAIKLMKLQKDIAGKRRLNIIPQFVIAPVSKEGSIEIFFSSNQFAGDNAAATRSNPYAGSRFTRVFEPRLDDASTTAWYMAGPKGKTVKVYFLNGNQGPYLETKQGWSVDGVEFKVRGDAAAKAVDWKALLKNAGA